MSGRQARGAVLLAASLVTATAAETTPPKADSRAEIIPPASTLHMAAAAGRHLDPAWGQDPVEVLQPEFAEIRAAAGRWLVEALAPLADPACRELFAAAGQSAGTDPVIARAGAIWGERPVATVSGGRLLITAEIPALSAADQEYLRASGVLPYEVALEGELVRAAGTLHTGPPPAEPLLRAARAARLEGAARLAGAIAAARAAGTDAAALGSSLSALDQDRAGWPRQPLLNAAPDSLVRAALQSFLEDGLRWALFHYVRGGWTALVAALERPGEGPEDLLRPGLRRHSKPLPEGCRLGPRIAAAWLTGEGDPPWVDRVTGDSFALVAGGSLRAALVLEDPETALAVASELADKGWKAGAEGDRVVAVRILPGDGEPAGSGK